MTPLYKTYRMLRGAKGVTNKIEIVESEPWFNDFFIKKAVRVSPPMSVIPSGHRGGLRYQAPQNALRKHNGFMWNHPHPFFLDGSTF